MCVIAPFYLKLTQKPIMSTFSIIGEFLRSQVVGSAFNWISTKNS